jgi:hypothetical protein
MLNLPKDELIAHMKALRRIASQARIDASRINGKSGGRPLGSKNRKKSPIALTIS